MSTTVYVQNNFYELNFNFEPSANLPTNAYDINATTVEPATRLNIFDLNRSISITNGAIFSVFIKFSVGSSDVVVTITLVGTTFGSDMSLRLDCATKGVKQPYQIIGDGSMTMTVQETLDTGQQLTTDVTVSFLSTSGYDDVQITVAPRTQALQLWWFSPTLGTDRIGRLRLPITPAALVEELAQNVSNIGYACDVGNQGGPVEDDLRPTFRFDVPADLYDYFFNSPFGYRGQFYRDPAFGDRFNRRVLDALTGVLIDTCGGVIDKDGQLSRDEVRCCLGFPQAKIWIAEIVGQFSNDCTPVIDIMAQTWIDNIDVTVDGQCKPVWGVRASKPASSTIGTLKVKGGWMDPKTRKYVEEPSKVDRAKQINLYGFS